MSTQGESTSAPSRRVLVVDDNEDSVDSMVMLLELLGNQVYTARDGIEAADRCRPEVVLMDMGMPRMNGYDATRRIREQPWGREMIIIALTGWGQEDDKVRSYEAGCDTHIIKPIDVTKLEEVLAELRPRRRDS